MHDQYRAVSVSLEVLKDNVGKIFNQSVIEPETTTYPSSVIQTPYKDVFYRFFV